MKIPKKIRRLKNGETIDYVEKAGQKQHQRTSKTGKVYSAGKGHMIGGKQFHHEEEINVFDQDGGNVEGRLLDYKDGEITFQITSGPYSGMIDIIDLETFKNWQE